MGQLTRRNFICGPVALFPTVLLASARRVGAQLPTPASAGPADPKLIEDLVAANRILVDQGVLDGYGHVSVRHDRDANRYRMSPSLAPELVTAADIMEYDVGNKQLDPPGGPSYIQC